jgi:hypothetical protein
MEAISVTLILLVPVLSSYGISFQFADNILVRLALVVYVLYGIRNGPLSGMLALLAAFTVILQRNHEIMTKLPSQMPRWPSVKHGGPMKATPLTPVLETIHYEQVIDDHSHNVNGKEFESADDLNDNNPHLPEGPRADGAESFFRSHDALLA